VLYAVEDTHDIIDGLVMCSVFVHILLADYGEDIVELAGGHGGKVEDVQEDFLIYLAFFLVYVGHGLLYKPPT
jgi:hypothetical protein